jgi:hypothetical protein
MEFQTYTRKPFEVEAVLITEENIAEIAPLVGELGYKEDGSPFISVNPRLIGGKLWRVYPGFYLTKMGDAIRCYSRKSFARDFELKTTQYELNLNADPEEGLIHG